MLEEYTHPDVFTRGVAEGWAEPISNPRLIDWKARLNQAWLPFTVIDGEPVCPAAGPFPVDRGRNSMGYWGENRMVDAFITVDLRDGCRYLLLVVRGDGLGLALPGGKVEDGETAEQAAWRELSEETGLELPAGELAVDLHYFGHASLARWVPDPRGSRQAWAVTKVFFRHLGVLNELPSVRPQPGEVNRVIWQDVSELRPEAVFAAHRDLLFPTS